MRRSLTETRDGQASAELRPLARRPIPAAELGGERRRRLPAVDLARLRTAPTRFWTVRTEFDPLCRLASAARPLEEAPQSLRSRQPEGERPRYDAMIAATP